MPNFLPHHLGGMTLHQPRIHVFLIFFIFLEFKCHGTPCMCPRRETNMFENNPSNLLHMELTRTQVHKYDFPNRYG